MPTDHARAMRAARQQLLTARLMGVDSVPVARTAPRIKSDASDPPGAPIVETRPVSIAVSEPEAAPAPSVASGDKRARLDALRARYERESEVAKAMPGWTNVVFHDGDPDARLMFIGEAPGADEDAQGVPFVGRAGQKLNEMIVAMGLSRESVYIANILKVRPPNNRTPTPDEAQKDGPFLLEQIYIVAPEVIVTLGRPASHFILGTTDAMGALRGRWHEHRGYPVMPTYHPAYLLRSYTPENRRKVWSDLQQVMERLGGASG